MNTQLDINTIAIDFGTTRTKIACLDPQTDKPRILELGREIRSIIPSLFYIPEEGEILLGDDAVEASKFHKTGVVRGLKMEIDREKAIRKNNRKTDRVKLASLLFSHIKSSCNDLYFNDTPVTDCIITIPPSFSISESKKKAIEKAAKLGGFETIKTVEEPVAAAKHWLSNGKGKSPYIFVCDIGGGTSDFALLERTVNNEDYRLYSELPPKSVEIGGNDIDETIYDLLDFGGIEDKKRTGIC